jgi:PIN domain nuclease of toxin-antitoxin system
LRILTDTHTIFWALSNPERLSKKATKALSDAAEINVSVVNLWELILKKVMPNALTNEPATWWDDLIANNDFSVLPVLPEHMIALDQLVPGENDDHKDPWDRLLVAQCKSEGLTLVSKDRRLSGYGVPIIW